MKHRLLVALAVAALAVALPARAQLTVQITQGVEDPIPVAIVPFGWESQGSAPYDVAATVAADLERSGRFKALPRGTMIDLPQTAAQVDAADWRLLKVDY